MDQSDPVPGLFHLSMGAPFLFLCPNTGLRVQATDNGDEPVSQKGTRYLAVECLACRGFHFVDPATGKLMSDSNKK
ncbi:hypothetical protein [Reyranella sp.]|uniref:hypothetical protein n=1 Tax=Reyranella sp. TaxID=1929291 RepID=UPI003784689E